MNLNLYHYGGNNPIKYVDPDGREDIRYYNLSLPPELDNDVNKLSLEQLNEVERYRSNLRAYNSYINETVKLMGDVRDLQGKIDNLRYELFELEINYLKQAGMDCLNFVKIFGQPIYEASQDSSDPISFGCSIFLHLDPQDFVETIADYMTDDRITGWYVTKFRWENKREIRELENQIKDIQKVIDSYDVEIKKLKREMDGIEE